jgi:nucleoside-diphosphate-sugar epimerase
MKVLLTGGSGNLGQTLVPKLLGKGDTPLLLDVRAPPLLNEGAVFIEGSVLDRSGARWRCPWAGDGRWSIPRPAAWGGHGGIRLARPSKHPHEFLAVFHAGGCVLPSHWLRTLAHSRPRKSS